ncbi:unnamed protein product [Lupinus luteus]|uniref:Exocyst complex subunit EXOC6/Sec15 C-terminal domain-containing protein n=1 Tax=Lupinus luteus TaxID=3873 RepID=A0AAV1XE44_LUPLU
MNRVRESGYARKLRMWLEITTNNLEGRACFSSLKFYEVVKKYLDKLLNEDLDEASLQLINTSVHGVNQAMQVAANMTVLERACDFFFCHVAKLSGVPLRMVERSRKQFPLRKARDVVEGMLSRLLKVKVDGFMTLVENVNWMTD